MFEKIYGHDFAKKILGRAIRNENLTNAYMFAGPEGVGKAKLAREFAQNLIGLSLENTSDFIEIDVKKDESSIKIEAIRKINSSMNIQPYGKYKVYLINNADKMTVQAQNALLKTLEEPSSYGIIILVTKNKDLLLETIRSRCIEIKFSPLANEDISKILRDKGYNEEGIQLATLFSRGNASLAIDIVENSQLIDMRNKIEDFIELLLKKESYYEVTLFTDTVKQYSNQSGNIIELFELYVRDSILIRNGADIGLIANKDRYKFINKMANILSVSQLGQIIDILEETRKMLSSNCNFNSCMQTMSLNIYEVVNKW